jgi:hypothetical protein
MPQDLTQAQLEMLVNGAPQLPNVIFYEKAALDRDASDKAHKRIYAKVVYIKITQPGLTDWAAYKAQKEDFAKFPEEYEYFLNNKQGAREPGVEIIPGLDIAHLQELIDMGLATIPKLAAVLQVPPHLEYAKQAAMTISNVLQEAKHAQEKTQSEAPAGGRNDHGSRPGQESQHPEVLSPADRQDHPVDVGQSGLPPGDGVGKGENTGGVHESRRNYGGQDLVDNWKVEQTYSVVI